MKLRTIGRIISAVILGVLLAGFAHLEGVKRGQMGRDAFLATQGERFDRHYAKSDPIVVEVFASLIMAGVVFGAYELVAFGISKALKSVCSAEESS
jgi:hypothetical protein